MEIKDLYGKYDMVFSVGSVCGCSEALRASGLQFTSYPLDWAGGSGLLVTSAKIVAAHFEGWFEKEDLRLEGYSRTTHSNRHYLNIRNGQNFWHDFPCTRSLDEQYPSVAEKYRRRAERFLSDIAAAHRVLAVYCDTPQASERVSDADAVAARSIMAAAFPGVELNLLVFRQDFAAKAARESQPDGHVLVVDLDYHQLDEFGKVSHIFRADDVCAYLMRHFQVDDPRSEEEKAAYAKALAERSLKRWGATPWTRWVNKRLFRLWRHLDRVLVKRKVIPPEVWR